MQSRNKNKITRYPLLVTGCHECGQTIIEVIVAIAIFAVLSVSATFLILGSFEAVRYGGEQEKASAFAQEGIDAARSIVRQGWGKLPFGGPYGISSVSGYWQVSGSGDVFDKFSRKIFIEEVYRDGGGDITPSGTIDPRTKKITAEVVWETMIGRTNILNLISYFTFWAGRTWTETTTADFSDGNFSGTQLAAIGDGAITLAGTVGPGFACLSPTAFYDTSGVSDGRGIFVLGNRAYLVTENNPGGSELYIFDLTDQEDPQLLGSLDLGAGGTGVVVAGNYAYISSEDNSQELKIVNVSIPWLPFLVGSYNTPGTSDGLSIAYSGNYVYLVTDNNPSGSELYVINVAIPFLPFLAGSLDIGGKVNSIQVSGNYAYLATTLNSAELVVVDITNPINPFAAASLDLPSNADAADLYILGSYLYITTEGVPGDDFYIIDVTNPFAPTIAGSLDIGGSGTAVAAYGQNAFVGTKIGAKDLITIIDITLPSNPQIVAVSDAPEGWIYDLYYANNTLYAASGYNFGEFQIYEYETEVSWRCHEKLGIYNTPGSQDGRDIFTVGNLAYLVTANSPGAEFYVFNVSDPQNPTLSGSLNLGADANGIYVSGNYAYVASAHNSQELQIINISNPAAPTLAGSYNASGNADATDVWVSGNFAYLTRVSSTAAELYKINISNPAAPSLVGSTELASTAYKIYIEGNYAFLATSHNSRELIVVNILPNNPSIVGWYNTPGNNDGKDVFVRGTTAYLITDPTSGDEFFILDVSVPSSPSLVGSASWGGSAGSAYSVVEDGDTVFVGTSTAGSAVKIFDVSNPSSPDLISVITNVEGGALGLYYLNGYLYVASDNNDEELQIYGRVAGGGGGGGGGYALSGTYISSIFDAGAGANWLNLSWTEILPAGCDIQTQIRTAAAIEDIPTAEWSGPEGKDGDETDWFVDAAGEAIHQDHEGDQFIQYRVYFTGPGTDTGVFEDISIEYEV